MGARPSLSDGLLESLEDTLTESMLSPELPVGGERGISLTGELAALLSAPRNSLGRRGSQQLDNEINSSQQSGPDTNVMPKKITFNTFFLSKTKLSSVRFCHCASSGCTYRLSLFTMLFRGFGEVGLLSPRPSISQDKA